MENLLSSYRELETKFMRNVYELDKALSFRTLWEGNNPLASFLRVASESAWGTGRLNGDVQLESILNKVNELKDEVSKCFTYNKYSGPATFKWSFDNVKHKAVSLNNFKQLFYSCVQCYVHSGYLSTSTFRHPF